MTGIPPSLSCSSEHIPVLRGDADIIEQFTHSARTIETKKYRHFTIYYLVHFSLPPSTSILKYTSTCLQVFGERV